MSNQVIATGGVGGGILTGGAAAAATQTGLLPQAGPASVLLVVSLALVGAIAASMITTQIRKRATR